ncbi:L-rhamnose mutarotase [Herbaspirillum sp. alder98]|uniref:L-rhamnose mutarotase n=1 Tax=Herbaspirillum sp. alder98 TaxID=2913096 RepID=UPI001CD868FC|nr:L-rhamnose mutarotase [Herbaspirillum sp. alder98]MCA1326344.1 L-rhamnose mutarotase [Herbaspirillum sp. alder98]
MEQIAFTMQLRAGCADEYRRRHDAIWPELAALLHQSGVRDYSIFLDPDSGKLFAVLRRTPQHGMDCLPLHPLMQRWWTRMADLMETGQDCRPLTQDLVPMFHLP